MKKPTNNPLYTAAELRALTDHYHSSGMAACRKAEPLLNRRSDMSLYQKAYKLGLTVSASAISQQMKETRPEAIKKRTETIRQRQAEAREKNTAQRQSNQKAAESAGANWGFNP